MKRLIPIIAALFMSGPALAASSEDVMRVQVGDLNLDTDRGAAVALSRIRATARRFCGDSHSSPMALRMIYIECRNAMTARAIESLGHPRVTALHRPASPVAMARR